MMAIVKEESASHNGRRSLKYTDKISYDDGINQYSNTDFIAAVREKFEMEENACWFVHAIEIQDFDKLILKMVIVDKANHVVYLNSSHRRNEWLPLIRANENSIGGIGLIGSTTAYGPRDFPLQQIWYGAPETEETFKQYDQFITAIKTKPFVLLAGISGTGKSRIVRQLARACDTIDDNPWTIQKPSNFEMIQVRPDWHDGSELLGYESRISGTAEYVVKDFVKFIVKAWIYEDENVPFFLCLDEMNLAPVEQYFAEYLSVVESRRLDEDGNITCDPLLRLNKRYCESIANEIYGASENDEHDASHLSEVEALMAILQGLDYCIPLPKNLIVMGTVNMDETTFGFSRKVLDRAMTIEMNEVDLHGGLEETEADRFGIMPEQILPDAVEGKDVYGEQKDLCDRVIGYLEKVNGVLENTPFKIAYRTRNEFLIYAVSRGEEKYLTAMDEMTSMKVLSRIEGDREKTEAVLKGLDEVLEGEGAAKDGLSRKKIAQMLKRLNQSGYTSYWN